MRKRIFVSAWGYAKRVRRDCEILIGGDVDYWEREGVGVPATRRDE